MSFSEKTVRSSNTRESLGVALDKNINFKCYIKNICCKANNKIRALFRVRHFLTFKQAKVLADAYVLLNFRYCPIIWMFCPKCSNTLMMNGSSVMKELKSNFSVT